MKIALLGYGKMGKVVEKEALAKGHEIVLRMGQEPCNWEEIEHSDMCIDFSHAQAVMSHLEQCALRHRSLVIGTTGWDDQLTRARALADRHGIGVLFAPNFSLGVYLFLKMLEYGAQLMNHFTEYDVAGIELHHSQKKDAPSGTAREMCRRLERNISRTEQVNMTSVRVGSIPGKHLVLFDSPCDTISICHEARNRDGFARGAIAAAEWLGDKKGFYTLDDFFQGVSHGS